MKIFIKNIWTAPVFEDNDKTHQAFLLHVLVWTLIFVPIPYFLYTLFFVPQDSLRAAVQSIIGETINITLLVLIRRGYVRVASYIQVISIWLFFTITALTSAGIHSEGYLLGYPLAILIAGVLLGVNATITLTAISILAGGWMAYTENIQFLVFSEASSPISMWILSALIFPLLAILQYLSSQKIQAALQRTGPSEHKYKLISSLSSDYIFETAIDKDGVNTLIWVGGAFEKLTGFTFKEYVETGSWLAHIHPDDIEKDVQDFAALSRNERIKSDVRTITKNGDIRWSRISAVPVWDQKKNKIAGIIGSVQDVTEQKRAEATLAHERDLLQIFMDNIPDQIYFKDAESRFVRINQSQANFLEIGNPQNAIGKTDLDFQTSDLAQEFMAEEKQIMETGEGISNRIEFNPTNEGNPRWLSATKVAVKDEHGSVIGIIGISRDVTEQKQTESLLAYERDILQIFMDNIPDQIYFKDAESRFIRINQAQAHFLGINNPENAFGKTDLDFQNPELARELLEQEKQVMETGQPVWNHIEFNRTEAGLPRWLSTTKVPAKNELGQTIGIIGISRNITEQKKTDDLEQNRREILEKVIRLGQHVTEVHDLRTTLRRIWDGIRNELGFDRVGLFLYNDVHKSMDGTFGTNNQGEMTDEWETSFSLEEGSQDVSPFLQALKNPKTIFFTNSYAEDYSVPMEHTMYGVKDHALIAIWSGEKPTAIISVDDRTTGRPIKKEQLEALRLFAGYVGLAIENARLNTTLEDELAQRGEMLLKQSAILNGIPDMAWLKDKDSRYIATNVQFAKTAGMTMEEIAGKTDFDIWQKIHAEKYRDDDLSVMHSRHSKTTEEQQVDSRGIEYWVETTKTPILNASGEVTGTVGIAREITERKKAREAEQQRRIMLEKVIQLGKRVTEAGSLQATIKKIWRGVHDDLGFDRLAIFLFNPEHNAMDDTVGTNNAGEMVDHWDLSFPIDSTFAALLQNPNGFYFTQNYDVENNIPEGHDMYGVKDYVAIAAWAGDKPVAVICTENGITHHPISDEQLEALRLFGGYAGLAIENSRLGETVQKELAHQKSAKERERERRETLEKIIKLGQNVTEANDLYTTLTKIWHGVHDDLGFDRLAIFLYNPVGESMDGTFGTNDNGEMTDEWHISHSMTAADNPRSQPFFHVLERPDTIYVSHDFEGDYNIPPGQVMSGVKDFASIAAWAGDKPVAFISVDHKITGRPITDEQLEALRLFVGYAGLAIENSRLNSSLQNELTQQKYMEGRERERRAILEKVIKLGQYVTEVKDLETTIKRIWDGVHNDLGFDRTGIYLYNADRFSMDGTYGTNNQGEMIDEWHTSVSMDRSVPESASFRHVLDHTDTIYLTHAYEEVNHTPQEGHIMSGVKDFAAIAARAGEKPVAVICVDHNITRRPFTDAQLEALRLFAGYAGLAIENTRLNSALESELAVRKNFILELEAKNAELERFTYTVSHDLKSPLVTIRGFLGYLERDAREGNFEKFRKDTQRIETAVEKMQNLLQDLLELSRIGRLINPPMDVLFSEIVKDALEIVHGQIEEKNIAIKYKENNMIVRCDRVRLTEALQNLLENATKFMGSQPKPKIEVGSIKNEKNETIFYVKDNGIGIAPEFHENIFGLFNKLETSSNGTGIGLALVKRIIEVHGGRIWIESQAGKGSTFYFTLPQ